MRFRIGDFVREICGGLVMRVIDFVDSCRIAVCRVCDSGVVKRVAVELLVVVGIGYSIAHGHGPEEPPSHLSVERQYQITGITSSGTPTLRTPVPPPPVIARQPDDPLLYEGMSGGAYIYRPRV
jgi:hypothetical protein